MKELNDDLRRFKNNVGYLPKKSTLGGKLFVFLKRLGLAEAVDRLDKNVSKRRIEKKISTKNFI